MTNSNDQIRRLYNKVHFAGILAELEPMHEGVDRNGKAYIQLRGKIQCGPSAIYTREFRSYIPAVNSKGEDSKQYKAAKEWYAKAVPMTKDKDNPTYVDMSGSMSVNDYVSADGKLHEGFQYSMQFFNDFKDYACEVDMEGYIKSIVDEERGQDDDKRPTGRKIINLYSMDFYHNVLNLKKIIVPKDIVPNLDYCEWEAGRTVKVLMKYTPNNPEEAAPVRKGFGVQRTTGGNSYLELVVEGGDPAYAEDSKDAIDSASASSMMKERIRALKEVEDKGYQGKNSATTTSSTSSRSGSFKPVEPISDDDIPF